MRRRGGRMGRSAAATAALVLLGLGARVDATPAMARVTGVIVRGEAVRADGRGAGTGASSPVDPVCDDRAFSLFPASWSGTYRWRFKRSTVPADLGADQVVAALKRAAGNVVNADNDCGEPDAVEATHRYLGGTSRGPNISSTSACGPRDGVSVVAFGDLAATDLGMACWWSMDGALLEADIKLNKADYDWVVAVPASCLRRWSVEAVATHEFGHAFGLDHVSEVLHHALTMSPLISPCQREETTLGHGDLLGLEARY